MSKKIRTHDEIIEFIDSKDAITISELGKFIYPNGDANAKWKTQITENRNKLATYWDYVLKTKNWEKLREYRNKKICDGNLNIDNFNAYKNAYKNDRRIREYGSRRVVLLLKNLYGLSISRSSILNYKKRIEKQNEI